MSGNNTIRKLSAGFLLLLFALCVTPKKTLHDLIADHKDTPFASTGAMQQHISNSGFRCNCDDLVVESPFICDYIPIDIIAPAVYTSHIPVPDDDFRFLHHFYFELRGPPGISAC